MMTGRQIRQLNRLRGRLNNDPHLSPEEKRKQLYDFAQAAFVPPPPAEEINSYLDSYFLTEEAAALARYREAAGFMAGQPPS
jgi:hypothetical protein